MSSEYYYQCLNQMLVPAVIAAYCFKPHPAFLISCQLQNNKSEK